MGLPSTPSASSPSPGEPSGERLRNEFARETDRKEHLKYGIRKKLEELASRRMPAVHVPSRFDERARLDRLDWLGAGSKEGKRLVRYCRKFVEAELGRDLFPVKGPLLMSPSGFGKTHLVYAVAREIAAGIASRITALRDQRTAELSDKVDRDEAAVDFQVDWPPETSIVVTSGSEIAHDLRASIQKNNLDSVVARYRQSPVVRARGKAILCVDDIEVFKPNEWLGEELYRILDFRYAEGLPTMIATNLAPEELAAQFGDRIGRRILDMTEPFLLK